MRVRRAHAQRRAARAARARGMTLIELSIAIGVLGLILAVAVPSLQSVLGVHAREEAGRLSGAIRYLYGASALYGKVCRLAFDLEEQSYWAECTGDRFTIAQERSVDGERVEESTPLTKRRSITPVDDSVRERVVKRAAFSNYTSEELPRRKLREGVSFSVWSAHQTEKYDKGTAYLYFFPQGYTEKARIWVESEHGDVYTLSVSPLNGRVRVVPEDLEVPRS